MVPYLGADECELLYGRAGYLYSLLWVDKQLGEGTVSKRLIKVSTWPLRTADLLTVLGREVL